MTDPTELRDRRFRVIDQKTAATGHASDTSRVVGFGLMVVYFTLTLADSNVAAALRGDHPWALYAAGALGVLTVLFDYLQYVCAASSASIALHRPDALYDPSSWSYRAQQIFFRAKQGAAIVGSLAVIYLMALAA